ncbi:T9SS type A sorting domain-containing protein [Parabacteroides distasonis]|uniref:T9SS type A sorting domain-containing protein n=1 Tax=Parabacteroides distasonis TaxID=823 RepID=UPI00293B923C|nr:T9SS type A sorting domain-containing protein [Parabacteroides distasonis]
MSRDQFLLYLELDSAYSQSTPVVKANGRAITPNRDGSYTIAVYEDIRITIEDIIVSTARITDNKSRIRSSGGILYIDTSAPLDVSITTMAGKLIRHSPLPAGSNHLYGLPAGFYVVRLSDGTTAKVGIAR